MVDINENEPVDQITYDNVVALVELPDFVDTSPTQSIFTLDVVREGNVDVFVVNDTDTLYFSDEDRAKFAHAKEWGENIFANLHDAHDFVKENFDGAGTVFGKGVTEQMSISEPDAQGLVRIVMSFTEDDAWHLMKWAYHQFLQLNDEYLSNPNDFTLAYNWLERHPAFWKKLDGAAKFERWSYENGLEFLGTRVHRDEEHATPVIRLRHGAMVEPERTMRYHDPRLNVNASSFEEAYIQLAALVHKFFDEKGAERENVEYEKNEEEIALDLIFARYDNEESSVESE